jgi:hypothetical protein
MGTLLCVFLFSSFNQNGTPLIQLSIIQFATGKTLAELIISIQITAFIIWLIYIVIWIPVKIVYHTLPSLSDFRNDLDLYIERKIYRIW